ncbi:hypothetical protein [Xanthobacter sp. VNH20]|uniref:hypothetical protein n=1 Tax=Xanthobacter sp. VNH20 TaxID=3156616 RepID=UPI0032B358AF
MTLDIEFTGRITANDSEVTEAIYRALEVFSAAGVTPEQAAAENAASLEDNYTLSELWKQADYEACKDMGDGAALVWK